MFNVKFFREELNQLMIEQGISIKSKRNQKECHLIEGWNAKTSYRFNIIHLPEQGLIRLRLYEGSTLVLDSGNIIDTGADRLSGGKLGVYCDSQESIMWSALSYKYVHIITTSVTGLQSITLSPQARFCLVLR